MPMSSVEICKGLFRTAIASVLIYTISAQQLKDVGGASLMDTVFIVNIQDASPAEKLAASVAIGLLNRHLGGPSAVTLNLVNDWKWVDDIRRGEELAAAQWVKASVADFLAFCVDVGAIQSVITYALSETWSLATLVTLAGIESAVPVPAAFTNESGAGEKWPRMPVKSMYPHLNSRLVDIDQAPPRGNSTNWGSIDVPLGLDALGGNVSDAGISPFLGLQGLPVVLQTPALWANELEATLWAWEHLFPSCNETESVVVVQRPEVLQAGHLADLIVLRQLFVFFLPEMCSPGPQQDLFRNITEQAFFFGEQLEVMGFNPANEVVADCSVHHTEVSLVSDWSPNLSFYSMMPALVTRLEQVSIGPGADFNPNHTYLAVINSDGDNLQTENNGNRDGMEARVQLCAEEGSFCPPLAWTMASQLSHLAPTMLQWYFDKANLTGRDSFLLGPSGYGLIHPAAIAYNDSMLDDFVDKTIQAADQLSMTAYVHWDTDGSFIARTAYYSRFEGSTIDTIFAPGEYHIPNWIGNIAGIQEQIRWGIDTANTSEIAQQANELEQGTIGYIYKIFDVDVKEYELLAQMIDSHVHFVDYRQLRAFALQKRSLTH